MRETPSLNGRIGGRQAGGRFGAGNPGGPGNPFSARSNRLRAALYAAVTPEAVRAITKTLIKQAVKGDVPAARLLVEWTIQKPADDPMVAAGAPDPARAAAAILLMLNLPPAPSTPTPTT